MKISIAQQNYHIGDFYFNQSKIIVAIEQAIKDKSDLIVLSELCVIGYPPQDLLLQHGIVEQCEQVIHHLLPYTNHIGVMVGVPTRNIANVGKPFYNSALLLYQNKIQATIHKTLLPTYDIFDEYRYFEPASDNHIIVFKDIRIALTICEDIWNETPSPLYTISPLQNIISQNPDIIINMSASPFDYQQREKRQRLLQYITQHYHIPLIYANAVGAQTDTIFDGGSLALNRKGDIVCQLPYFKEAVLSFEYNILFHTTHTTHTTCITTNSSDDSFFCSHSHIDQIHDALLLGIIDYFKKMNFTQAIIGLSGGIDSAVVLALASKCLPANYILAILMPSAFSSTHSIDDAVALCKNLSVPYHIISISAIYDTLLQAMDPIFNQTPFSLAEENLQSRIRGTILMAISNKKGHLLLNTSNKSELATGYGTLYGDMNGAISILGDCYKQQVFALASYINKDKEIIPSQIISKEPSAELKPNQKDTDSLPPYELLDQILYHHIEQQETIEEIIARGLNPIWVRKIIPLVHRNEFKRFQSCPILRISPKAFGRGRQMPIVSTYPQKNN